jgi:hypothetical protein
LASIHGRDIDEADGALLPRPSDLAEMAKVMERFKELYESLTGGGLGG